VGFEGRGRTLTPEAFGSCALRKSFEAQKILELGADQVAAFIGRAYSRSAGGTHIFRQACHTGLKSSGSCDKNNNVLIIAVRFLCRAIGRTATGCGLKNMGIKPPYHGRSPRALALAYQPIAGPIL